MWQIPRPRSQAPLWAHNWDTRQDQLSLVSHILHIFLWNLYKIPYFLPSLTLDEGTHNMRKKIPQRGRWGGDFLLQMESSFKGLVCVGSLGCIVCLLYILPLVNLLASLAILPILRRRSHPSLWDIAALFWNWSPTDVSAIISGSALIWSPRQPDQRWSDRSVSSFQRSA